MKKTCPLLLALAMLVSISIFVATKSSAQNTSSPKFAISFPASLDKGPIDGRLLLLISNSTEGEPRMQINEDLNTQQVFGVDVDGWKPGEPKMLDHGAFGYPRRSLADVPAGEYTVQALVHRYKTFKRSDGHTVKLPMDRGEGQQWSRAPGNLYSTPKRMRIDGNTPISIALDKVIPPIEPPKDTKYIKHIKIQSERLTKFWGRPMHLGAHVLVPEGFDSHPDARYPLVIFHGHFPADFGGFREQPPDPNLKPDYNQRFKISGYNRIVQEHAYQFYKEWTGPDFPRFLIVEIQHANPYYDDSYAVNSANLGPYGDAITYELIPEIEKRFRGIGKGWARFLYGGSTGGWEAMAVQMFYPDEYNGSWAACPDPIDFRAYTVVNIYEHENAYYADSKWKRMPRPGKRNYLGELSATVEDMNYMELALGTNSRSGGQFDIWQAVYSPVGSDGYPKPIWDKLTGKIDRSVAEYWRENYDLGYILKRDWAKLGPKLEGKLNIYVGEADNYFLNNAVYLVEDYLKTTKNPAFGGEIDYEPRAEHCWNGDHTRSNAYSRLRYHQFYAPKIVERILKSAPPGADLKSWRY
jgi:hypothetical protein